jgi:hypothetical protein
VPAGARCRHRYLLVKVTGHDIEPGAPDNGHMPEVNSDKEPPKFRGVSRAARFGLSLYQQVAAVLAALGLAAVIGHFWHVGWRGFLATLVSVWDQTVRPLAQQVLHVLVAVPLGWFGIDVVLPTWIGDYLSVGAILALSDLRTAGRKTA